VFWADRVTTHKSTGHSPFYMAHGIEPMLPFDITLAMFLVPNLADKLPTANLITTRAPKAQRRPRADPHKRLEEPLRVRPPVRAPVQKHHPRLLYDFGPGAFVLVRNSSVENDLGLKAKPHYVGPMVVLHRTQNGSYHLAELDDTVSNLRFCGLLLSPLPYLLMLFNPSDGPCQSR
jgi:hypothetical protein